jgi:glycerate kinase
MNILIAPSGFKESLMADAVADCIEKGIRRIIGNASIHKIPVVDGGEGFAKILITTPRQPVQLVSLLKVILVFWAAKNAKPLF